MMEWIVNRRILEQNMSINDSNSCIWNNPKMGTSLVFLPSILYMGRLGLKDNVGNASIQTLGHKLKSTEKHLCLFIMFLHYHSIFIYVIVRCSPLADGFILPLFLLSRCSYVDSIFGIRSPGYLNLIINYI